jgi:hypothetical protein
MKKFAVQIHGRGFGVPADDGKLAEGFYVTVFVEAIDEHDAGDFALRSIVEGDDFHEKIGRFGDPNQAEVFVEHWEELPDFSGCNLPRSGFIFYPPDIAVH